MEKHFIFHLNNEYIKKLFIPIRTKYNIIEVLMNSIKYIYLYNDEDVELEVDEDSPYKMILYMNKESKISRFFYIEKNKITTIHFPFNISIDDEKIKRIYSTIIGDISTKLTSDVISLIGCREEDFTKCSLSFFGSIMEYEENEDEYIWDFIKDLLVHEDGYLRYDYDLENYEKYKARGEEKQHPLHHYDIFYSTGCTFKVGLNSAVNVDDMKLLLQTNANCKFLT